MTCTIFVSQMSDNMEEQAIAGILKVLNEQQLGEMLNFLSEINLSKIIINQYQDNSAKKIKEAMDHILKKEEKVQELLKPILKRENDDENKGDVSFLHSICLP